MSVIRRKLNEGEHSIPEQISTLIDSPDETTRGLVKAVFKRKSNGEGELSIPQQISERIRLICGWDEVDFYSQTGHGCMLEDGFMMGLWLGCRSGSGS
jgi:hypothetical protein